MDATQYSVEKTVKVFYGGDINPDPSRIDKCIVSSRGIFLLCETVRGKEVLSIDEEGNIQTIYGGVGPGPGQYTGVIDFDIQENKLLALTPKNRILEYDLDGNYLGFRELPVHAVTSICVYPGGNILYANAGNLSDPYRLWFLKPEEDLTGKLLKFDPDKNAVVVDGVRFHRLPWATFFFEYFSNAAYEVKNEGLDTTFVLDFGKFNFQEDIYNADVYAALMAFRKNGFYNLIRYFENKNRTLAYFFFDEEMPENAPRSLSIFYSKRTGQLRRFPSNGPYQYGALTVTDSGTFVFPVLEEIKINDEIRTEQLTLHFLALKE